MTEPNIHELARQVAVLEERMSTVKAELKGTLDTFRADMAGIENRLLLRFALIVGVLLALFRYLPDFP